MIDDGSTDESPAICDEYCKNYKNISVFHILNKGLSNARNLGIKKANGEYILFVDADDWLENDACEKMYAAAKENAADLVICANYNETARGATKREIFGEKKAYFQGSSYRSEIFVSTLGLIGEKLKDISRLDRLTPVWARLYSTRVIKENLLEYVDSKKIPSESLQFNFDFAMYAQSAVYIPAALYHYRRTTEFSVSKAYRPNLSEKWIYWSRHILQKINPDDHEMMEAYYSRICSGVIPMGGNALMLDRLSDIYREMKAFLNQDIISMAYANVDFSACPFYWKIFFYSARHRLVILFLIISKCMRILLRLRK